MKRISRISIKNFKAYSQQTTIENPKLDNLLIYGENGSGKTSLYKAITAFVNSSVNNALTFEKNEFVDPAEDGEIRITFKDTDNNEIEYIWSTMAGKSNIADADFIRDTASTMGYLDYKQLLEFYLTDISNPNLFDLVVIKLLGRYVIPGKRNTIAEDWKTMCENLFKVYTTSTKKHNRGLKQMKNLDVNLKVLLSTLQNSVNTYLTTYFPHMDLSVLFNYSGLSFDRGTGHGKSGWKLNYSLQIEVRKTAGTPIHNYTTSLNEARLSAIALCIYLSALKNMPQVGIDFQLLILDDVFIGIDTGNRMPMLKLLTDEFSNYQIVMTTYDRSWYNMAKEYFNTNVPDRWKMFEMYEGEETLRPGLNIAKPILTEGLSDFDHARKYLYDKSMIDYAASANYFRKALERLLTKNMPKGVITDNDKNPINNYKLSPIVDSVKTFLEQIQGLNPAFSGCLFAITQIKGLLHSLIHPFSHFVPDMPIYKNELMTVEKAYITILDTVKSIQLKSKTKIEFEKGTFVNFTIKGSSGWQYKYKIKLLQNIYSYDGNESSTKMQAIRLTGRDEAGNEIPSYTVNKKSKLIDDFTYTSFSDAVNKITTYLQSQGTTDFVVLPDIRLMFQYQDGNGNWQNI